MMVERIFEDVERDIASDEECEALLREIQSVRTRPNTEHKVKN